MGTGQTKAKTKTKQNKIKKHQQKTNLSSKWHDVK